MTEPPTTNTLVAARHERIFLQLKALAILIDLADLDRFTHTQQLENAVLTDRSYWESVLPATELEDLLASMAHLVRHPLTYPKLTDCLTHVVRMIVGYDKVEYKDFRCIKLTHYIVTR